MRDCLLLVIFLSTGCATILKGGREDVYFGSDPPGMAVYVDGQPVGNTPTQAGVSVQHSHTVQFKGDGYEPQSLFLDTSVGGGWIVADILLPIWWVNLLVDGCSGSWNYLDRDHLYVVMKREDGDRRRERQW